MAMRAATLDGYFRMLEIAGGFEPVKVVYRDGGFHEAKEGELGEYCPTGAFVYLKSRKKMPNGEHLFYTLLFCRSVPSGPELLLACSDMRRAALGAGVTEAEIYEQPRRPYWWASAEG